MGRRYALSRFAPAAKSRPPLGPPLPGKGFDLQGLGEAGRLANR